MKSQSWLWSLIAVLVLAGGSYGVFVLFGEEPLPQGIVYGNGHIDVRRITSDCICFISILMIQKLGKGK